MRFVRSWHTPEETVSPAASTSSPVHVRLVSAGQMWAVQQGGAALSAVSRPQESVAILSLCVSSRPMPLGEQRHLLALRCGGSPGV